MAKYDNCLELNSWLIQNLPAREEDPPEVLAARHAFLDERHDWLLAACGGCEHALHLLLDVESGRVSGAEAARRLGWTESMVSREVEDWKERIRWAVRRADAAEPLARSESGFTLNPVTATPVGPVPQWAVALANRGVRLPHRPTHKDLLRFLSARADVFRLQRGRQRYLGGWVDRPGGAYCLDVTVLIPDRETALAFARRHRERCITYLATGEEVWLSYRRT